METLKVAEPSTCNACHSIDNRISWSDGDLRLVVCCKCGARWLGGPRAEGAAYTYGDDDEFAATYLTARAERFVSYARRFAIPQEARLVDVGCGDGTFLEIAKREGWNPVGVELTEDTAALARRRSGVDVVVADISDHHVLPPGSCDIVTLWGVLEHTVQPARLLSSCASMLRPGGLLLLETPNPNGAFHVVASALMRCSRSRFQTAFRETLGAGHVSWYSGESIRAAASRLQMSVVDIRGSRNFTPVLLRRWRGAGFGKRIVLQMATATLNTVAGPIGLSNQLLAALRRC